MRMFTLKRALGVWVGGLLLAATAGAQVLTFVTVYQDNFPGITELAGPRRVVVSPDGDNVYVAAETDNAISVFSRDDQTGALSILQVLKDGQAGVDGLQGVSNLVVSPDGRHVYAGGTFEAAVAAFERDPSTGLLTQIQVLREPADVANGLSSVVWTVISQDGRNVYTFSAGDDAVVVFDRDHATGLLAFRQLIQDGTGGATLLGGVISGAISHDGKNVYVTARFDDAVTVFARDPATGELSFVSDLKDSVNGVDGLDGARAAIVGKNGKEVYVVSGTDRSIAVFDRDKSTGALTFVQVLKDNTPEADGLALPSGLVESHNGKYVFVAAFGENAISVFRRKPSDGTLTFVEVRRNFDPDGTVGIRGVLDVSVSPNGKHLYAGSFLASTAAVFDIARGN